MWTDKNRGRYSRDGLRYPSDVTDAEWALVVAESRRHSRAATSERSTSARWSTA